MRRLNQQNNFDLGIFYKNVRFAEFNNYVNPNVQIALNTVQAIIN